jgi:hypothetical protein
MSLADGNVKNVTFTLLSQILKSEPDFYANRKKEKLYEFTGKTFRGDPNRVNTAYPDE